ncbi:MAG: HEAT repeat domain-containing protein [Candidatus Riflebacteria bacterium]|nr:HEAT repeat domain-containing protein [Candidatus Riflebacteria bacterium]
MAVSGRSAPGPAVGGGPGGSRDGGSAAPSLAVGGGNLPWLLGVFHLLIRCSINVFFVLFQTQFFLQAGVRGLPWVYAAMNVVYIGLQWTSSRTLRQRSADCLLAAGGLWLAAAAVRVVLFPGDSLALAVLYLLGIMVFELFFNQFFTHVQNDVFPLQEAKRHLPTVAAFGSLSCIASGILLKVGLGWVTIAGILRGNLVLFAAGLGFFAMLRRGFPTTGVAGGPSAGPAEAGLAKAGLAKAGLAKAAGLSAASVMRPVAAAMENAPVAGPSAAGRGKAPAAGPAEAGLAKEAAAGAEVATAGAEVVAAGAMPVGPAVGESGDTPGRGRAGQKSAEPLGHPGGRREPSVASSAKGLSGGPTLPPGDAEAPAGDAVMPWRWSGGLVGALVVLGALNMVGKYWLDYQYSRAINQAWPTARDLASFIAVFTAATDAAVLLSQAVLSGRVLRRLGLIRTLSVLPGVAGAMSLVTAALPVPGLVLLTQFLFTWVAKSFHQPAFSVVLGAMPSDRRLQGMSAIGMGSSAASLAASLALIAFRDHMGEVVPFLVLAAVFAAMCLQVRKVDGAYAGEVEARLERLAADGPGELEDLERERRVAQGLAGTSLENLAVAEDLAWVSPEEAGGLLVRLADRDAPPRVRASAARALGRWGREAAAARLWERVQAGGEEPRVVANLLESLADLEVSPALAAGVRPWLDHPHHRVRSAAAFALVRWARTPSELEAPLACLWRLRQAADPLARAAAVAVLGLLQHEAFLPELASGLADPDERVRWQAARALERLKTAAAASLLREAAFQPGPAGLAAFCSEAAARLERLLVDDLMPVLEGLEAEERARAVGRLETLRGDPRAPVLGRIWRVRDPGVRRVLTAVVEGAGRGSPDRGAGMPAGDPGTGLLAAVGEALIEAAAAGPLAAASGQAAAGQAAAGQAGAAGGEVIWDEERFGRTVLATREDWPWACVTGLSSVAGPGAVPAVDGLLALLLRRWLAEAERFSRKARAAGFAPEGGQEGSEDREKEGLPERSQEPVQELVQEQVQVQAQERLRERAGQLLALVARRCPDPGFVAGAVARARQEGAFTASLLIENLERHVGAAVAGLVGQMLQEMTTKR